MQAQLTSQRAHSTKHRTPKLLGLSRLAYILVMSTATFVHAEPASPADENTQQYLRQQERLYDIFSLYDPDMEREKLLNNIATGTGDGVCKLIKLDKGWETDWWNININDQYLARDTAHLRSLAKQNPKIDAPLNLCLTSLSMNDSEFKQFVEISGYWGGNYVVPADSGAVYQLIYQLTSRKLANPQEVLKHYESQLVKRREEAPEDKSILDVLAFLYSQTGRSADLEKLDLYGWKELKIQAYAESYIVGLSKISPDYERLVEEAASDFPNSEIIQRINLALHNQSKSKPLYLMRFAAAQFANVKNHLLGPYRLNDYMASLAYEVNAGKGDQ